MDYRRSQWVPPRVVQTTSIMSSIRSRRRWIRVQLFVLVVLFTLLIFPTAPYAIGKTVSRTPAYQKLRAVIVETHSKHRIKDGDTSMAFKLASMYTYDRGYYQFIVGDPVEVLQPLVDKGNIEATRYLALLIRESDPLRARSLLLQAADLGDHASQLFYLQESGIDLSDTSDYLHTLYDLQRDRPGWKQLFNQTVAALRKEADLNNTAAQELLDELETIVSELGA